MFEAEFTHEGDRCTFEVLLGMLTDPDPGLEAIAEIVHDIDLKDVKFARPEAPGLAAVIGAIANAVERDEERRLEQWIGLFDRLHAWFRRAS